MHCPSLRSIACLAAVAALAGCAAPPRGGYASAPAAYTVYESTTVYPTVTPSGYLAPYPAGSYYVAPPPPRYVPYPVAPAPVYVAPRPVWVAPSAYRPPSPPPSHGGWHDRDRADHDRVGRERELDRSRREMADRLARQQQPGGWNHAVRPHAPRGMSDAAP